MVIIVKKKVKSKKFIKKDVKLSKKIGASKMSDSIRNLPDEIKKRKIKSMFALLGSLNGNIKTFHSCKKTINELKKIEKFSVAQEAEHIFKDFKSKHLLDIDDIQKSESIVGQNFSEMKTALASCGDLISDSAKEELISSVESYIDTGVYSSDEVISKIEKETGVTYSESQAYEESYTVDNYFINMADTYSKIAKGLARTASDLDSALENLRNTIEILSQVVDDEPSTTSTIVSSKEEPPAPVASPEPATKTIEPSSSDTTESPSETKETKVHVDTDIEMFLEEIENGDFYVPGEENEDYFDIEEPEQEEDNDMEVMNSLFAGTQDNNEEELENAAKP